MAPCTHPCTSREVHEERLPRTCSRPCAFEVKKTKKKRKSHQTLKKHTTKYIYSSAATATTSRRRAEKNVPLGSPYSWKSASLVYTRMYVLALLQLLLHPLCAFWCSTIFWPAQLRLSLLWYSYVSCLLYTSPSPRDGLLSRMPSSA